MRLCPVRNRVIRRSLFGNGSAEEGNQCNGVLGFLVAAARFDRILNLRNLPDWTGNDSWPEVLFEEIAINPLDNRLSGLIVPTKLKSMVYADSIQARNTKHSVLSNCA
jgi:hypothetical protein